MTETPLGAVATPVGTVFIPGLYVELPEDGLQCSLVCGICRVDTRVVVLRGKPIACGRCGIDWVVVGTGGLPIGAPQFVPFGAPGQA